MAAPEVKFKYGADISAHQRAMKRLKATSSAAASKIGSSFKIAGAIAVGAFVLMAKHSLDAGDKIHKLNLKLGISTAALSQLKHAGDLSGVSFNTMTKSIQKMQEGVSDAANGTGEARNALNELGLSAEKLKMIEPDRQLEIMADALGKVTNETDKVRVATDLFGARGVEMLQMLEGGSAGLREMRGEADALGMTLTQEGANNIAAFNDSVTRLKGQIMGAVTVIVAKLGPTLTTMADWFGSKLPDAIAFAVNGFFKVQEVVGSVVSKVVSGLIKFYDILGKVPKFGGPYRDAAAALREFNADLQTYTTFIAEARTETESFNVAFGEGIGGGGDAGGGNPSGQGAALDVEDFSNKEEQINSIFGDAMQRRREMRAEENAEEWNYRQQSLTEFYAFADAEQAAAEKLRDAKISATSSTLNYTIMAGKLLLQSSEKDNKAIFAVVKAASIGQALISTYTGAASAMKDVPYPYNFAAAASVIAYGMAQVASITSQGMGGGGGGGASAGVPVTSPTTAPPVDTSVAGTETGGGGAIHFHIEGPLVGSIPDEIVDDMVDKINEAGSERDVYINVKEADYAGAMS